jgi:hypothetical protein
LEEVARLLLYVALNTGPAGKTFSQTASPEGTIMIWSVTSGASFHHLGKSVIAVEAVEDEEDVGMDSNIWTRPPPVAVVEVEDESA